MSYILLESKTSDHFLNLRGNLVSSGWYRNANHG